MRLLWKEVLAFIFVLVNISANLEADVTKVVKAPSRNRRVS